MSIVVQFGKSAISLSLSSSIEENQELTQHEPFREHSLKKEHIKTSILKIKENLSIITRYNTENIRLIFRGKTLLDDVMVTTMDDPTQVTVTVNNKQQFGAIMMVASRNEDITQANTLPVTSPNDTRIRNDLQQVNINHKISVKDKSLIRSSQSRTEYCFQNIETLPGLPFASQARSILTELANDAGILAVMNKYKWKVGCLAELYPEGQVLLPISNFHSINFVYLFIQSGRHK
jgi:hypothetical protein